jgi:hypothetical protein
MRAEAFHATLKAFVPARSDRRVALDRSRSVLAALVVASSVLMAARPARAESIQLFALNESVLAPPVPLPIAAIPARRPPTMGRVWEEVGLSLLINSVLLVPPMALLTSAFIASAQQPPGCPDCGAGAAFGLLIWGSVAVGMVFLGPWLSAVSTWVLGNKYDGQNANYFAVWAASFATRIGVGGLITLLSLLGGGMGVGIGMLVGTIVGLLAGTAVEVAVENTPPPQFHWPLRRAEQDEPPSAGGTAPVTVASF